MMTRYRLTAPISAIRHPPAGAEIAEYRVKLPAGAMLYESIQPSGSVQLSPGRSQQTKSASALPAFAH